LGKEGYQKKNAILKKITPEDTMMGADAPIPPSG
jgi:hypothetical protein